MLFRFEQLIQQEVVGNSGSVPHSIVVAFSFHWHYASEIMKKSADTGPIEVTLRRVADTPDKRHDLDSTVCDTF